jgi:ribosomal-protein-alanine N-acetyltransferase
VLIRPAVADDIPAILKIEQHAEGAAHWTEERYRETFKEDRPRRLVMVAEDQSGVQGFGVIQYLHHECEVENLVVAPGTRRQGVGKRLLLSLIDLARSEGAITASLEVREGNAAARALYQSLGFREWGRRKRYYHNPEEDAILYRLECS